MYGYFGMMPSLYESWKCCSKFQKEFENRTGQKYSKSDNDMYNRICKNGDEEKAIKIAKQKWEQCVNDGKNKPSEMCPCTTVYLLVDEIRGEAQK